MGRRKTFLEEYGSDSGSSDEDDEIPLPGQDEAGEFAAGAHRRKRRRTGREAKEAAALGIFGSDSEDERPGRWKEKNLRNKGMGFVSAGQNAEEDEEEDDYDYEEEARVKAATTLGGGLGFKKATEEEEDYEEEEEEERPRLGLGSGLGFKQATEENYDEEERPRLGLGGRSLGGGLRGFAPSFQPATAEEEDAMEEEEEEEEEEVYQEPERPRLGLGGRAFSKNYRGGLGAPPSGGGSAGASGASTPLSDAHPGLGFGASSSTSKPDIRKSDAGPTFVSPFGKGFVSSLASAQSTMPKLNPAAPSYETPIVARPSAFGAPDSTAKKGKGRANQANAIPAANPNSFAARMMAKMGYKAGEGLGKQGQGRLEPVAPKVRPQNVGVGAVREMSEQEKKEARRAAAMRGEVLSDSDSEKERKARRKKKQAGSTGSTPGGTPLRVKREKTKFRTAEEISASVKGLEVPSALKNIIDFTGREQKLLSSASGLMTQVPAADGENMKLAKMARRDLESFAGEWKGLQDRKAFIDKEESRLGAEIDAQVGEMKRLGEMVGIAKALQGLSLQRTTGPEAIEALVTQLEVLQFEFKNEIESHGLADLAVAALHPIVSSPPTTCISQCIMLTCLQFKAELGDWNPLDDPFMYREYFRRLSKILGIRTKEDLEAEYARDGYIERSKMATPYESMVINLWLPKVRAAINNDWDVHKPAPVLSLLDIWSSVLPSFVQANVLSQLILPKLRAAVSAWNPRLQKKRRTPPPHIWVFQWLPYLGVHMDELLRDMRTKFGVILDTWDLSKGTIDGLEAWREVFGPNKLEQVLIRHLLPRLAVRLRTDFSVNPADQVLEPLEDVFKWTGFFKPSTLGHLMEAEFFPKWLDVLHMWLTARPVLTEVQEWYMFWQDVFPDELRSAPSVKEGFRKGLDMMNDAIDLGDRAATDLQPPEAGPTRPIRAKEKKPVKKLQVEVQETTFRDVVEDWCAENNLLLVPLRKAHEASGSALFRITASASGAGGVMCYFKGDVVWCQDRKNKELWEPMGLGTILERLENSHR